MDLVTAIQIQTEVEMLLEGWTENFHILKYLIYYSGFRNIILTGICFIGV